MKITTTQHSVAVGVPNNTAAVVRSYHDRFCTVQHQNKGSINAKFRYTQNAQCKNDQSVFLTGLCNCCPVLLRTRVAHKVRTAVPARGYIMERCSPLFGIALFVLSCAGSLAAQSFQRSGGYPTRAATSCRRNPSGRTDHPARRANSSLLAAGPFGLAVSPEGKTVVTANGGPGRNSLTILEHDKNDPLGRAPPAGALPRDDAGDDEDADWRSVFMGIAFVNEHSAWVSEGNSGKIALFDWNGSASNGRRRSIDLNQKGYRRQLHRRSGAG